MILQNPYLRTICSQPYERNKTFDKSVMLVQLFAYRGNSQRRNSAAIHIIDMVWLYRLLIPMGRRCVFYLFKWFQPAFAAPKGRGRGQHPVDFNQFLSYMNGFLYYYCRFPAGAGDAFHEHVAPVIMVDVGAPEGILVSLYWSLLAFPFIHDVDRI